ncbi:MAG: MoxR family ATPase [Bacteroidota bacterium]
MPTSPPRYHGTELEQPVKTLMPDPANLDNNIPVHIPVYIPSKELIDAVNICLYLRRPLLLMGEPGCGKTRLAEAVAYALYGDNYLQHYFEWNIKSTTEAREGIYTFDSIRRLRESNVRGEAALQEEEGLTGKDLEQYFVDKQYIQKGPLAKAFDASQRNRKPSILLIDEVDKAEIDFPNDLLLELDRTRYYIAETDTYTEVDKAYAPIIFITSNNEKELPAAFLRRCLFHYIQFPSNKILNLILKERFVDAEKQLSEDKEILRNKIIQGFETLRERLKNSLSEKLISTSELIDWYDTTLWQILDPDKSEVTEENIREQLDILINEGHSQRVDVPFFHVLLKNLETISLVLPEAK